MWHELLAGCSKESIRSRFSGLIKQFTHEMATRYCFIDYDREIAIVAEIEEEGRRKLVGVGRWWPTPTMRPRNTRSSSATAGKTGGSAAC